MPIFEYKCKKCGNTFEALVASSSAKVKCEKCSSSQTEKLISSFAAKSGAKSSAKICPDAASCPSASHSCGCSCACGHHHS